MSRAPKKVPPATVTSIKATNPDMTCRGFQFEVGKTYELSGPVSVCGNGFHACPVDQHPFSVLDYYPPASRFFEVEQGGETEVRDNKLASATITIGVELSLGELTRRAVEWVFARAKKDGAEVEHATGTQGAASATGTQGAASATGTQGAASATGYQGAASATGTQGAASATGTQGAASATGYQGAASATGYQGAASATGYQGAASATGTQGAASATGDQGAAMAAGCEGRVSGSAGNALFAVERDMSDNILSVACGIVGRDGIEPGVWYQCKAGKLVAA